MYPLDGHRNEKTIDIVNRSKEKCVPTVAWWEKSQNLQAARGSALFKTTTIISVARTSGRRIVSVHVGKRDIHKVVWSGNHDGHQR